MCVRARTHTRVRTLQYVPLRPEALGNVSFSLVLSFPGGATLPAATPPAIQPPLPSGGTDCVQEQLEIPHSVRMRMRHSRLARPYPVPLHSTRDSDSDWAQMVCRSFKAVSCETRMERGLEGVA